MTDIKKYNTKIWLISFFVYFGLQVFGALFGAYAKYTACTEMGLDAGASSLSAMFLQRMINSAPILIIASLLYYFAYLKKGTRFLAIFLAYTLFCNIQMLTQSRFYELALPINDPVSLTIFVGCILVGLFFIVQCIQLYRYNRQLKK